MENNIYFTIEEVIIPDSVTEIGNYTFDHWVLIKNGCVPIFSTHPFFYIIAREIYFLDRLFMPSSISFLFVIMSFAPLPAIKTFAVATPAWPLARCLNRSLYLPYS